MLVCVSFDIYVFMYFLKWRKTFIQTHRHDFVYLFLFLFSPWKNNLAWLFESQDFEWTVSWKLFKLTNCKKVLSLFSNLCSSILCFCTEEAEGDKKKKDKKKKGVKEEKKKGPSKATVKAMQDALAKMKEEEERANREEEERQQRLEELEAQRQEQVSGKTQSFKLMLSKSLSFLHLWNLHPQERLETERKEKKKQKDKERKERLKKEGKLLTKTQKEARARAEATLRALQAQGENMTDSSFDERNSKYFWSWGCHCLPLRCWSAVQRFNAKEEACLLW